MDKKTILYVDDDSNIVQLTKVRLEANGYAVITASNGAEAWDMLQKTRPDLMLLDLLMPTMEGPELCTKMHQNESTKDIPIIIVTAAVKKEIHFQCLKAGAKVIVLKPFNPNELLVLIKKALDPNTRWRKAESILE